MAAARSPADRSVQAARRAQAAALVAFVPLAKRMKRTPEEAARALLDRTVDKIAHAVADAAHTHDFGPEVPVVALGGAGTALAPEVARRLGRPYVRPQHPEILSSIGAALSLVRVEIARHVNDDESSGPALADEAERACVDAGAAPATVVVETSYDAEHHVFRAVATGAVALETGPATRSPAPEEALVDAAALALRMEADALELVADTSFYRVYSENGSGRAAVVDLSGAVPVAENTRRVLVGEGADFVERLRLELDAGSLHLGVATMLPRVVVVCGSRILDLSDARRAEDVVAAAEKVLAERQGPAVALLAR